ncbi:arylsulfatase [Dyadobacter psychrotolerans]|uniref:N-acetylgalactosamine-6-sulfatase n=1 Tax=Dyadobacter psychrotolerans TaxID=2541721 RepID=A0A4R5D689_9BACT|nr:arylsulfatase [Dyadobacter psychrotolerans]TDE09012.1 N-acetylgalactosamine-6-sulfatase [Dyadobacter psychrotolerans]
MSLYQDRWLALLSFLFIVSPYTNAQKIKTRLPNIIFIYADDLGYAELGCYGQKKIKTPNLDRLARQGIRFTQHYTSMPVCAPARAMLMTGKHGGHAAIRGNLEMGGFKDDQERGQMPLPDKEFTIGELLKQKGYATALIGKWGLGMFNTEGAPLKQGFDYFYGYLDQKQAHNHYPSHLWENDKWDTLPQPWIDVHKKLKAATATENDFNYFKGKSYASEKMTEKALRFIEQNKRAPFFLYLPYAIPHVSLQAPDEYINEYLPVFNERPYYGNNGYASTKYPLATYAAMITYLDDQVGIILQKIKQLGLDENTIIMFSSDNGTTFNGGVNAAFFDSVAGLRGLKMDVYEGGIREPFIVRWPGKITAGSVSDHVSAQYDLMATLAELTGQKLKETDGISFLPELLGQKRKQQKHDFLYWEYPEKGGQLAIRIGNWKGVKTELRKNPASPWQIFNLKADPKETNNLAGRHPELIKKLDAVLKREHTDCGIADWDFIDNTVLNTTK